MTTAETNTTDKSAAVAAQGAHAAPEKAPAKKAASQKQAALKAKKAANGAKQGAKAKAAPKTAAKSSAKASKKAAAPRAESKGAKILEMIARAKGATLGEIMKATNWQAHDPTSRRFKASGLFRFDSSFIFDKSVAIGSACT